MSRRRPIVSHSYEARRLRLMAANVTGTRVLDIGYAQQPSPHLWGEEVVGLDLRPVDPDAAPNYTEHIVGDATDLVAATGSRTFDTVLCGELIEHVEDPYSFLRQVRPLVDDRGALVISTPNPIGFPVCVAEALRSDRYFFSDDHRHLFTPRWVGRMLDVTGFELVSTVPVGLWLPRGHIRWCPVWMSYIVVYVARPRSIPPPPPGIDPPPATARPRPQPAGGDGERSA